MTWRPWRGIAALSLILALGGCFSSDSEPEAAANPSATPSGEVVNGGTVTESGATVTVNDASSPINGAQIKIAADTLVEPEQFTLSYEDKLPGALNADALALGAKALSKVIVLTRTGSVDFGRPVEITVPFDKTQLPADGVPIVVYWDVSTSSYSPIAVTAVDRDKGTITFVTAHASQFVVLILDKLFGSASPDHNLFTTDMGFRPSVDGFFVHNFGSYDAPGGNCFGMAAYSAWYEHAKKASRGAGLMSLYLQGDAAKEEDDQVARELIALVYQAGDQKAHISALNAAQKMGLTNQLLDRFTALSIIQQLIVTKQAQILAMGVYTATGFTSGHAVTVYAYDGVNKQFQLYDNRFPGEVVTVPWDWANGFGSTSKKDTFNLYGFASFNSAYAPSTLAYFYGEAEAGFPASHYPSINLSTPSKLLATATYEVSADTNVLIEGAVARPADATNPTAQRYLHVYLNGTWQPNPVAISQANDTFQYTIPQLPNAAGTDVMLFVSERAQPFANGLPAWAGGFHAFKQFKLKLANQSFFTNLGFESGDFTSWVSERHTWGSTTSQVIPSDKSGIVSGADAIATSLTVPLFGKYAARVNNEDSGYHISTLTQTAVVPATKNPVVKFYWAAVLEDPNHPDADQPYVEVTLVNQSKGNQVIYKQRFFSDDPAYSGWVSYRSGQWKSIPWQAVEVPVAAYVGDTLVLKVEAADCAQGAHGGYVYVDADD